MRYDVFLGVFHIAFGVFPNVRVLHNVLLRC